MPQHQPSFCRARYGGNRCAHGPGIAPQQAVARPFQRLNHAIHLEGLHQVVKGVHLKSIAHIGIVRRSENDNDRGIHILYGAGAFHAAHLGHFHIQKHHVGLELFGQLQRGFSVPGLGHQRKSLHLCNDFAHHGAHARVIVGDEHTQLFLIGHFFFSVSSKKGAALPPAPFAFVRAL